MDYIASTQQARLYVFIKKSLNFPRIKVDGEVYEAVPWPMTDEIHANSLIVYQSKYNMPTRSFADIALVMECCHGPNFHRTFKIRLLPCRGSRATLYIENVEAHHISHRLRRVPTK